MAGPSFDRVIDRADKVTGRGNEAMVSCPVAGHGQGRGDVNPSLHVTWRDGKTLLDCQIGCHVQDVLMAFGLEFTDLFDEPLDDHRTKVAEYVYTDRQGAPRMIVERWETGTGKTFVQRLPGAQSAGIKDLPLGLYRLPQVLAEAVKGGTVYVVEGEKCVHAMESMGVVATTGPGGAKKWQPYFGKWLLGCSEVVIVADNDEPGREHARVVRENLRGLGIPHRVLGPKMTWAKADVYDHAKAGLKVVDLIPVDLDRTRPKGKAFAELLRSAYPPVKWAVNGVISTGLTLLGGAPKMGKSHITLDIALGVACGGRCFSGLSCNQGSVLYLSLDNDSERRIQERALYLMGGRTPPDDLPIETHVEWPTGIEALAACQEWVASVDNPLLVVVDTLVRAEPQYEGDGRTSAYASSVAVLSRWSRFAADNDLAVVAVHHDRKATKDETDWMDRFMGSRGLTAAAQTLMMVEAKRGAQEGVLHVAGRDIGEEDYEMSKFGRSWVIHGGPEAHSLHVV